MNTLNLSRPILLIAMREWPLLPLEIRSRLPSEARFVHLGWYRITHSWGEYHSLITLLRYLDVNIDNALNGSGEKNTYGDSVLKFRFEWDTGQPRRPWWMNLPSFQKIIGLPNGTQKQR